MLLRYTERARSDLMDIHRTVFVNNPSIADACIRRITSRCLQLATFPRAGPVRPDIAPYARALAIERWLAIDRITPDGAQIVRVIDGGRDLSSLDLPTIPARVGG